MELALYPFKTMRITQRHDEGNHLAHWKPFKYCSDKPFDEALDDGGRSYFYPYNDFKIEDKFGSQESGYNVRLVSVNKLKIPYKSEPDYLKITLTHLNRDDYEKIRVGQVIHKKEMIIREGTSGKASGNHFHVTANLGKYYGFKKNGNGKWCFVYEKALTPTEAFYLDETLTDVKNKKGYNFISVNYKLGSVSDEVEKIDKYLSDKIQGNYYGYYTSSGIKAFQEIKNLNPSGEVDLKTFEKLLDEGVQL